MTDTEMKMNVYRPRVGDRVKTVSADGDETLEYTYTVGEVVDGGREWVTTQGAVIRKLDKATHTLIRRALPPEPTDIGTVVTVTVRDTPERMHFVRVGDPDNMHPWTSVADGDMIYSWSEFDRAVDIKVYDGPVDWFTLTGVKSK